MKKQIQDIIEVLEGLHEDGGIPRNVKDKVVSTIAALKKEGDFKMCINKALHELEEVADDPNLQAYTRTQIWNIVSLLEKVD